MFGFDPDLALTALLEYFDLEAHALKCRTATYGKFSYHLTS